MRRREDGEEAGEAASGEDMEGFQVRDMAEARLVMEVDTGVSDHLEVARVATVVHLDHHEAVVGVSDQVADEDVDAATDVGMDEVSGHA